MQENFEELLEYYIDEEEIEKKKKLDNEEIEEENKGTNYRDLKLLKGYAITMTEFLRDYIKIDITKLKTNNLTHKNLKDLTHDNPFVIGISNDYVDIDEIIKRDYLVVVDCFGNVGSYLNPCYLRDITRLELVEKELKILAKARIVTLEKISEHYFKYKTMSDEYNYLEAKCSGYYELLRKANKRNVVGKIEKYIEHFGIDILDTDEQSSKINKIIIKEKRK